MISRADDGRIEQSWNSHFARPMAAIQSENRRVFGGLVKSLGVGCAVPTADHLKGVEYLFRALELVASQLPGAQPQSF